MGVWIETSLSEHPYKPCVVTPFVGVWIETSGSFLPRTLPMSHPSWVCGLKLFNLLLTLLLSVTPFVGVWIETLSEIESYIILTVTPFVGVWIETAP